MAKNKKSRVSKENKSPKKSSPKKTSDQTKGIETEKKQSSANEPTKENVQDDEIHEAPPDTNCKCMQKKPGGKYFCFRLVQGRWIQSSAIPFDTKEFCEEICC